jgi:hypothetical protein
LGVHGAALDIKDIYYHIMKSEHECALLRLPRTMDVHGYISLGDGKVFFTDDQKQLISNMDETKFSMDGSDGEIEGRPANSITIAGSTRYGTATDKSSLSTTLMCGSTGAGEPLPIHAMFSPEAQEENMVVDYRLIADFPRVQGRYGHDLVEE